MNVRMKFQAYTKHYGTKTVGMGSAHSLYICNGAAVVDKLNVARQERRLPRTRTKVLHPVFVRLPRLDGVVNHHRNGQQEQLSIVDLFDRGGNDDDDDPAALFGFKLRRRRFNLNPRRERGPTADLPLRTTPRFCISSALRPNDTAACNLRRVLPEDNRTYQRHTCFRSTSKTLFS